MKNLYILCFVLVASTITVKAQNKETQKADKLFRQFEYVQATKEYLKLIENGANDNYICKQLAESYYSMFNPVEAIKWYAKTILKPQDAETYYKYAQMFRANGQYDEANKQMATFASKAPNDQRAKEFKANPNYLPQLLDKRKIFDVEVVTINSDKSEFGALLANDNNLYFASARNKSKKMTELKRNLFWIFSKQFTTKTEQLGHQLKFPNSTPNGTMDQFVLLLMVIRCILQEKVSP